jgi:hypothetical protein
LEHPIEFDSGTGRSGNVSALFHLVDQCGD